MGVFCKIESSKLTNANRLMYHCEALTDWDSPLDNLVDGSGMFMNCYSLTNFRANLKNLETADGMFYGCSNLSRASLAYIAGGLKDVLEDTSGTHYFGLASSESIDWYEQDFVALIQEKGWRVTYNSSDAPIYTRESRSYDCTAANASYWSRNLTNSLIKECGTNVFNGVFTNYDDYMYCYIANEDIEIGEWTMQGLTGLQVWDADLPKLKSGTHMFESCSNLHTFRGDLSSLECGYYMFAHTALTSWEIDLPSMKIGDGFLSQSSVSSFNADLSSLVDSCSYTSSGSFQNCYNLTSFRSNLSSLKGGYLMFSGCQLDSASVANIAETIKDISSLDKTNDADWTFTSYGRDGNGEYVINTIARGRLDLGLGFTPTFGNGGLRLVEIYDKGWTVYINGTDYTSQI